MKFCSVHAGGTKKKRRRDEPDAAQKSSCRQVQDRVRRRVSCIDTGRDQNVIVLVMDQLMPSVMR